MKLHLIEDIDTHTTRIQSLVEYGNSLYFLNAQDNKNIKKLNLKEKTVSIVKDNLKNFVEGILKIKGELFYVDRVWLQYTGAGMPNREFMIKQMESLKVHIVSIKTGERRLIARKRNYTSAAFSETINLFVFGSDRRIDVVDWNGNLVKSIEEHKDSINDLCFNNKGTRFVSAGADYSLKYWEVPTFKLPLTKRGKEPFSVSFDGTDRYLAVGHKKGLKIWDTEDWSSQEHNTNSDGFISALYFSEDGEHLYTADWDGTIFIWEVEY